MPKKSLISSLIFFILCFTFYFYVQQQKPLSPSQPSQSITPVLGEQTKSTDCVAQTGLPDSECTPGAVFPNVTVQEICRSGYSASVRNVSTQTKKDVYEEYGITSHLAGSYEVDHLISLELGGSNDIANLWPEAASPTPGFHEKDLVENYLHDMVCKGKISLGDAQNIIAHDWLKVYNSVPNIKDYNWGNH